MKMIITQANLTLIGGAERTLLKIAKHYKAKIYTAEYDPRGVFPGYADLDVEVVKKGMISSVLPYGRAMQGLHYGLSFYGLKLDDYDVINAHIAPSHWIRNKNERVLWYCHTPLREVWDLYKYRMQMKPLHQRIIHGAGARVIRTIDRKVVNDIEFIFTNSKYTRQRVIEYFGRTDAQTLDSALEYENYKYRGDEKFFFYPGRFSPNKQQLFAIEAFRIFRRMAKNDKYKLVLAGAVSRDSAYQSYYDEVLEAARAAGNVKVLTNISDEALRKLYGTCTAALYPPLHEDYGLIPLEAMASGKPIISLDEGGPRETIENGRTGFLVRTPREMADKMLWTAQNPSLARRMGKAGVERVKKRYSYEKFFEVYDKKVRQVAKS